MQLTNSQRATVILENLLVPAVFTLGVFLLGVALLLQIDTYAPGEDVVPVSKAFALTLCADACFLYLSWRGGWVVRILALFCALAALFNTCILLRWAVITIHP